MKLGEILIEQGKISKEILSEVLNLQADRNNESKHKYLGHYLLDAGFINIHDLVLALSIQRSKNLKI